MYAFGGFSGRGSFIILWEKEDVFMLFCFSLGEKELCGVATLSIMLFHEHKVRPSKYQLYCEANKPKHSRPHTIQATKKLRAMENYIETEVTRASQNGTPRERSEIEKEAMRLHLGPEKSDRTKGAGAGVMKSQQLRAVIFASQRLRIADENVSRLVEENTILKERLKEHNEQLKKQQEWLRKIASIVGVPSPRA